MKSMFYKGENISPWGLIFSLLNRKIRKINYADFQNLSQEEKDDGTQWCVYGAPDFITNREMATFTKTVNVVNWSNINTERVFTHLTAGFSGLEIGCQEMYNAGVEDISDWVVIGVYQRITHDGMDETDKASAWKFNLIDNNSTLLYPVTYPAVKPHLQNILIDGKLRLSYSFEVLNTNYAQSLSNVKVECRLVMMKYIV